MKLPRYLPVLVFLAITACLMTYGAVSAQEGGKSLPELKAQAQKIKVGETTEAEVISLMGQPSKTHEGMTAHAGGRDLKNVKRLIYGPERNIVVVIDSSTSKVLNVKIKPAQ